MAYTPVPTHNIADTWTNTDHNTYIVANFAAGVPDVFTAKGDLFFGTAAADVGIVLPIGSANQFLTADSTQASGNKWAAFATKNIYASYYSTGQTIAGDGTVSIVNYDTSIFDTATAVTTGAAWKFTVPASKGGFYLVQTAIILDSSASWGAGESVSIDLYKNGSAVDGTGCLDKEVMTTAGTYISHVAGGTIVSLAAGDYIDVRLAQTSGANAAIGSGITKNWIAIARLF